MNGGLSQDVRVLRSIRSDMDDDQARKILRRIDEQLQPPVTAPAEDRQADEDAADTAAFPLDLAIFCAVAVAFIIWRHAPWAADLLERAAR
jgi:hypothetical protein